MQIREVMTTQFETLNSTSSLNEAAQKMQSLDVGVLPIQEGMKLIGLITDRDIVIRGLAQECDPSSTQVKDIMSSQLVHCYEEDSAEDAAKLMQDNQIRRLIVCDQDGKPTGIVTLGDIAVRTKQDELAGAALETISASAQ